MIYLTLKCTLAHSKILKSRLELNFVGGTFFFSRSRAGLTNRVPVRDSRAGAPLLILMSNSLKSLICTCFCFRENPYNIAFMP